MLNSLAATGHFAAALSVGTLIDQYATMFSLSQEANKLLTRFTRVVGDPLPPAPLTEVFFDTSSAQRLGVAVLKVLDPATPADVIDEVEIARWDGTTFQVEKIVPQNFEGHIYLGVSDASAFNGGTATWRIRRFNGTTVKPITLDDVFAFEDLHVKSTLALDKKDYRTGDPMQVAVEIRNDGQPVLGATVRAVLDAPARGIGSLLATLDDDDLARQRSRRSGGQDQPRGRAALVDAILQKHDWDELPRTNPEPGGLFVDGTDLLHDVDGNGIYTNTFRKVNAEGVYNWTMLVNGTVVGSNNQFSHRLDRSTLADIGISRRTTVITREITSSSPAHRAVKVTTTPKDDFENLLGPGTRSARAIPRSISTAATNWSRSTWRTRYTAVVDRTICGCTSRTIATAATAGDRCGDHGVRLPDPRTATRPAPGSSSRPEPPTAGGDFLRGHHPARAARRGRAHPQARGRRPRRRTHTTTPASGPDGHRVAGSGRRRRRGCAPPACRAGCARGS